MASTILVDGAVVDIENRRTKREKDGIDMFVGLKTFKGEQIGWNGRPKPLRKQFPKFSSIAVLIGSRSQSRRTETS